MVKCRSRAREGVRSEAGGHEAGAGADVDDGLLAGEFGVGRELLDDALVVVREPHRVPVTGYVVEEGLHVCRVHRLTLPPHQA
jgi:hypothetical protein